MLRHPSRPRQSGHFPGQSGRNGPCIRGRYNARRDTHDLPPPFPSIRRRLRRPGCPSGPRADADTDADADTHADGHPTPHAGPRRRRRRPSRRPRCRGGLVHSGLRESRASTTARTWSRTRAARSGPCPPGECDLPDVRRPHEALALAHGDGQRPELAPRRLRRNVLADGARRIQGRPLRPRDGSRHRVRGRHAAADRSRETAGRQVLAARDRRRCSPSSTPISRPRASSTTRRPASTTSRTRGRTPTARSSRSTSSTARSCAGRPTSRRRASGRFRSTSFSPSKIVRLADGKLWISFFDSAQLGRFDDATGTLDIFTLDPDRQPFDIHNYRGLVVYSDLAGQVGFLDPAKAVPTSSTTLTLVDVVPGRPLVLPDDRRHEHARLRRAGPGRRPFRYSTWEAAIPGAGADPREQRKRALGDAHRRGERPHLLRNDGRDRHPGAAAADRRRGTCTSRPHPPRPSRRTPRARTGRRLVTLEPRDARRHRARRRTSTSIERLLPDGWIAGLSGTATPPVPAGTLVSQTGRRRRRHGLRRRFRRPPDHVGQSRPTRSPGRASRLPAPGGGTLGYAANAVKDAAGLGAGDTGFLFASPDAAQRTIAGLLVTQSSTGTISIVDASGVTRAILRVRLAGRLPDPGLVDLRRLRAPGPPVRAHRLHGHDGARACCSAPPSIR